MARPRRKGSIRRIRLTLGEDEEGLVRAYAEQTGRPIATAAARVLVDAVKRNGQDPDAGELERQRARVRELESQLARLHAQLEQRERRRQETAPVPRWEQTIAEILADHEWWSHWLPRLDELVGRDLKWRDEGRGRGGWVPVVDEHGYADFMTLLFPEIRTESGGVRRWNNPEYGKFARLRWETQEKNRLEDARPVRSEIWEPVIRHTCGALCALQQAGHATTDPYLRLRIIEELRVNWIRTLSVLIGASAHPQPDLLPQKPIP